MFMLHSRTFGAAAWLVANMVQLRYACSARPAFIDCRQTTSQSSRNQSALCLLCVSVCVRMMDDMWRVTHCGN